MTPEQVRADYRGAMDRVGGLVTLKRGAGGGNNEVSFKARVTGYAPNEQTGDVQQGDSKIIFLAEDLGTFPVPIKEQSVDAVFVNGRKMTVQAVDDWTRSIAGVLIAYELRVRG